MDRAAQHKVTSGDAGVLSGKNKRVLKQNRPALHLALKRRPMYRLLCCSLLLLFLCALQPVTGQDRRDDRITDSLVNRLATMRDDTGKCEVLNTLSMKMGLAENTTAALRYSKQSLALATRLGWLRGEMTAYNEIGTIYETIADYPAAIDAYFKAMRISEDLHLQVGILVLSGNISNIFLLQKDYPQALKYSRQFLHAAEEAGDTTGLMMAFSSIGNVYIGLGEKERAIECYEKQLAFALRQADTYDVAAAHVNIGAAYIKLGRNSDALRQNFEALRLTSRISSATLHAAALSNIGEVYLNIARSETTQPADSFLPTTKAAALNQAISYLEQSADIARQKKLYPDIVESASLLAAAYRLRGDYKAALDAYDEYTAAKDTVFNEAKGKQIHNLEIRRALELGEAEVRITRLELARKRVAQWAYIGGLIMLLVVLAALLRSFRRQRKSNKLLTIEKQRSDSLLLNILPQDVAEELKQHGTADARQFEEVTVLFTDFVNFTGTAEHLSPRALVAELHECFSAFDAIAGRNGLEKIKTVGDAYIAACGLPQPDPRHAQKCVQAAKEMRDFIAAGKGGSRIFDIRIGINSGPVVAGIVGVKKFAYDIWGDTVNTAARMEQHSEPGKINLSGSTYALVREDFKTIARGRIAAKNKGEIEMYFLDA